MRGPKRAGRKKRLTGWLLCAFWLLGFYSPQAEALRHLPERLVIASGQETAAELPFPLRLTADVQTFLGLAPGQALLCIRSSDIAFTMGARGPLLERARAYPGEIPAF